MQAGSAEVEDLLAQLGGDGDADAAYVGGVLEPVEAGHDLVGEIGARRARPSG